MPEQSLPANLIQVLQSSLNMLTAESLNRIVSTNESEVNLSARGFMNGSSQRASQPIIQAPQ